MGILAPPESEQCIERVRRVTHPAEPVVPVRVAAQAFGQRGRGGGRDPTLGLVREQLQHERGPRHGFVPRPVVIVIADPRAPHLRRLVEPALDLVARRAGKWLVIYRDEREQCARSLAHHERGFVALNAEGQQLDVRALPSSHREANVCRHRVRHTDRAGRSAERRLEHVRFRDVAALGLEAPFRLKHEAPAAPGIEQRSECGRRREGR